MTLILSAAATAAPPPSDAALACLLDARPTLDDGVSGWLCRPAALAYPSSLAAAEPSPTPAAAAAARRASLSDAGGSSNETWLARRGVHGGLMPETLDALCCRARSGSPVEVDPDVVAKLTWLEDDVGGTLSPPALPSDERLVWRSRNAPPSCGKVGADARRSCSDEKVVALMVGGPNDTLARESDKRRNVPVRRGWPSDLCRLVGEPEEDDIE